MKSLIKKIDHIVITSSDIEKTLAFYKKLGFIVKEREERYELYAGDFKINVHILHHELLPHAQNVQVGSADLCFEIEGDLQTWRSTLLTENLLLESEIVTRNGVNGIMHSFYLRDPDKNLIEFCSYL